MMEGALVWGSLSYGGSESKKQGQAMQAALALYRRTLIDGRLYRLWGRLTGRTPRLFSLAARDAAAQAANAAYAGLRVVPIEQIRGSESRSRDFDRGFHPLRFEDRSRWLGLAAAWLLGTTLPPVELIQVGGDYYVRDGHHRISVARALGQSFIDAEVTVWRDS